MFARTVRRAAAAAAEARAIVCNPRPFLFDEPLSNRDAARQGCEFDRIGTPS
jgi:hypothetical protein